MASGMRMSNDPEALMKARLRKAISDVEDTAVTWTGSNLFGKIDIDFATNGGKVASEAFREGTEYAASVASKAIEQALDVAVSSPVWNWSSGGARDIVDTGRLKDSLSISVSGGDISIYYSAPYASVVHEGGYIRPYGNKKIDAVYLPGRPWVDAVLFGNGPVPSVDLDKTIGDAIDSRVR